MSNLNFKKNLNILDSRSSGSPSSCKQTSKKQLAQPFTPEGKRINQYKIEINNIENNNVVRSRSLKRSTSIKVDSRQILEQAAINLNDLFVNDGLSCKSSFSMDESS